MEQQLNYDAFRFWLEVLLVFSSWMAAVYTWHVSRTRATTKSIDLVDARVTDLRSEFSRMEIQVNNLPNHDDIGQVYNRLSTMDSRLSELIGGVTAMSRGLENINNYLLNKER